MSKKLYYTLFFIGILLFFHNDVSALTCQYNETGYSNEDAKFKVVINPSAAEGRRLGSAWDDITLLWDTDFQVKNWNKNNSEYWNGKVNYEASSDFNGECPKYLVTRYVVTEGSNYYFAKEDNIDTMRKNLTPTIGAFKTYVYIKEKDDSNYGKTISCTYADFIIQYTEDGKAVSVERNRDSKLFETVNDTIRLSTAIQTKYEKWNGSCPTICYAKNQVPAERKCSSGGGMSVCFDDYKLYYNSSDAGNSACVVESCLAGTDGCKTNADGSTYNGICDFYDTKLDKIDGYYSAYSSCSSKNSSCTANNMKAANREKQTLLSYCNSAYSSADYSDPCVKECINLDTKLSELKDKYFIDDENKNASCGLSARIANWIMKIINWLRYIVPVLLIILSILDFLKAIAADSEDEVKKVTSKFAKRLIVAVIIFLLPLALEFLLGIFGIDPSNFCL